MYRSALVALKPEGNNDVLIQYALDLAKRHQLYLAGAVVLDRDLLIPLEPVPLGGMAFKQQRDETLLESAKEKVRDTLQDFAKRCQEQGIEYEVSVHDDSLGPDLARAAQPHDVLLLGRASEIERHVSGDHSQIHAILRRAPGPAIVVPGIASERSATVVVAFDGSVQAARALKSFVASGFHADCTVQVVACAENEAEARESAAVAAAYLKRHGRQVETVTAGLTSDASTAEHLLGVCRGLDARLLVMGAYGKPAIREFFLGSVTRSILDAALLPIFLDH